MAPPARRCPAALQFEMMERQDRDGGHGWQNPDQWNITLGDDAEERGGEDQQDKVEDMEDVQPRRIHQLLRRQRLQRNLRPMMNFLLVELASSHWWSFRWWGYRRSWYSSSCNVQQTLAHKQHTNPLRSSCLQWRIKILEALAHWEKWGPSQNFEIPKNRFSP